MKTSNFLISAKWTPDCQGKQDYDGHIISISTRYWPGNYQSNGKISATSSIILRYNEDDYEYLAEKDFEGDSEAEVKSSVEEWAQEQMSKIVETMRHGFNF